MFAQIMLIAKHNKRQSMQGELLVSLSMKEMGYGMLHTNDSQYDKNTLPI